MNREDIAAQSALIAALQAHTDALTVNTRAVVEQTIEIKKQNALFRMANTTLSPEDRTMAYHEYEAMKDPEKNTNVSSLGPII